MSVSWKPLGSKHAQIYENATGVKDMLWEFNPGKYVSCFLYKDMAQRVLDMPVRQDDTWMISYPRTGSTWCQEILWLIGNNLDFEAATNCLQQFRAPLLESSAILPEYAETFREKFTDSVEFVNSLPSPRYIKTHLSYQLLPNEIHKVKPKIIYTIRNPKDVCVSFYFYTKLLHNVQTDFETFCELFLDEAVFGGGIFRHYFEYWNRRHESNILILRYEEMVTDITGTIRQIAKFMEKPLSEEEVKSIEEFVSIEKMKKNRACNTVPFVEKRFGRDFYEKKGVHFIRKGKIGDWKNHMSPEIARKFDEYIEKHTRGTDLTFD